MTTLPLIQDCVLIATGTIGFTVSGDAVLVGNLTDAATAVEVNAGGIAYVLAGEGNTYSGAGLVEPLASDRAAWDALNFSDRHTNDIDNGIHWTQAELDLRYGSTSSPWFNVKTYGALGDGATDDTTAITAAITAIPTGGGVLYFPAGDYKVTSGLTLAKSITVRGDGSAKGTPEGPISRISFTSATQSLFTVTAHGCSFKDIYLLNSAVSTPSAGAGITVQAGNVSFYDNLIVAGFYIDMDMQDDATIWAMNHCFLYAPIKYALKIANASLPDAGDWNISNSSFVSLTAADAAIRIESSGGGKITNTKINSGTGAFVNGIDLAVPAGVTTGILQISNSSIENVSGDGIHLRNTATSDWHSIIINGLQFGFYPNTGGHAVSIVGVAASHFSLIIIDDCVFRATGSPGSAIDLQYVDTAYIGTYVIDGFPSLLTTSNTTDIKQIGAGTVTSIAAGTGITATPDPIVATGTIAIANTAVTPATYGDASNIPQITVDQQGRITAASNIAISVFTPINAYNETQTADGVSLTYYLTNIAAPSTIRVYIDGIRQPASDDSAATDVVTFDVAPDAGALLLFDYEMDIA